MADPYHDLDLDDDCSPLRRTPPHSSHPFGNPAFLEMLRRSADVAERPSPTPEQHGEPVALIPSSDDLRDRRIRALEADVAALRCELARFQVQVSNLLQSDRTPRS